MKIKMFHFFVYSHVQNGMTLEETSVPRSSRIASRRRYLLRDGVSPEFRVERNLPFRLTFSSTHVQNVTSAAPPSSRIVGQRRYLPRHEVCPEFRVEKKNLALRLTFSSTQVQNVTRSAPPYPRSDLLRGDQQNDEVCTEFLD